MKHKIKWDKNIKTFSQNVQMNIRDFRKECELSQEDMMDYELSLRMIQRIKNSAAVANITLLTLYRLAKAFGVKPKDLLDV